MDKVHTQVNTNIALINFVQNVVHHQERIKSLQFEELFTFL